MKYSHIVFYKVIFFRRIRERQEKPEVFWKNVVRARARALTCSKRVLRFSNTSLNPPNFLAGCFESSIATHIKGIICCAKCAKENKVE